MRPLPTLDGQPSTPDPGHCSGSWGPRQRARLARALPSARLPGLSVVVPAYNEADNLSLLVKEVRDAVSPLGLDWELLIVDDGSDDDSSSLFRALGSQRDSAWRRLVSRVANRVRSGLTGVRDWQRLKATVGDLLGFLWLKSRYPAYAAEELTHE